MTSSTDAAAALHPGYTFLIWYTIIGAFAFGMPMFFPEAIVARVHETWAEHIIAYDVWYRCLGSLWLSLSFASVLALQDPLRFSPMYICQLVYKSIWILTTCLPRAIDGSLHQMDGAAALLMLTYIIMDVLFLPWGYILKGEVPTKSKAS